MTWQNGDCLQNGKYLILEELGEGGFGITYKAKHTHLNQIVVIKTPNDARKNDPNYPRFVERFIEEGRKLASLSEKKHPHIVRATDLFFEGTLPCLAMDFVEGENLVKIVERKPLSEAKALEYIRQIGEALCVVHGVGMVHRDAHPANIMVKPDGNAVLIDFGLAADVAEAIPSSQHDANRGFAPYEQMQGNGLPTVDVYTLAATLYFIVTRRPPTTAVDRKFNKLVLPEPKSFNPNISDRLNRAILKGMELESKNRSQSMRAWLDLLPVLQFIPKKDNLKKQPVNYRWLTGLAFIVIAGASGVYLWQNPKLLSFLPLSKSTITSDFKTLSSIGGLSVSDTDAASAILKAREKYNKKDFQGALADVNEAIRLKPDFSLAYSLRAYIKYTNLKDLQGAILDLNEAIKINRNWGDSSLAEAYFGRGYVKELLGQGDWKGIIEDFNEGIRLKPDDGNAYFNRGNAKTNFGDYKGAIADYSESIRLLPEYASARHYYGRGNAKSKLGDNQGAIADYNQAIKINQNWGVFTSRYFGLPTAYFALGVTKYELREYKEAILDYNEAIRLKLDYDDAYNSRGVVKKILGDYKGAIADYNQAIKIQPNDSVAYYNRAAAKFDLGDKQGALSDASKAIELDPKYAMAYSNRGTIKYELEDKQGALSDYNKAIELDPKYPNSYHGRGMIKSDLGDKEGSQSDYREAARLYKEENNMDEYFNMLKQIK